MATSDIVAISLIILCGLFGIRGWFRWASGLIIGLLVGCLILGAIGVASNYTWSGQVGRFFESGTLAPYAGKQMENVADSVGLEVGHDTDIEEENAVPQNKTEDALAKRPNDAD